jgi:hypothetical protein
LPRVTCVTLALFRLGFPAAPAVSALTSRQRVTRWLILQKARRQACSCEHSPSTACKRPVSGSFHSPHRGSFHLSLTVLVRYRSSRVFSLGQWSALLPTRFLVPRGTQALFRSRAPFAYRALTVSGVPFQCPSAGRAFSYSLGALRLALKKPPTPDLHQPQSLPQLGFGLFPFRSPLLGESSLFLRVLRCFSSPRAPSTPMCSACCDWPSASRVSPFGYPRFVACTQLPEAFRSVPRPSSALDA